MVGQPTKLGVWYTGAGFMEEIEEDYMKPTPDQITVLKRGLRQVGIEPPNNLGSHNFKQFVIKLLMAQMQAP